MDKNNWLLLWGAALRPQKEELRRAGCLSLFLRQYLHAEAQRPRDVRLPVRAVKHERPSKTTKEHPVRVGAQLHSNTSSQNHKDCRRKSVTEWKGWVVCKDPHQKQSYQRGPVGRFILAWFFHRHQRLTFHLKIHRLYNIDFNPYQLLEVINIKGF